MTGNHPYPAPSLKSPALRIPLIYLAIGVIWILFSDELISYLADRGLATTLSILKGWIFVAVTACILYFLIRKCLVAVETSREQTAASDERFRNIFSRSPIAIGIGEVHNGLLVEVNDAWLTLYGYERDEVIGRTTAELDLYVRSDERDELIRKIEEQGQILNHEIHLRRKDGAVMDVLYSADRIELKGGQCLQMMMTDITEQKRHEKALRESEKRLRRAEEMAHLGHWRFDLASGRITWSDEMYRIFGLDQEESGSGPTLEVIRGLCHPEDMELCVRSFEPVGHEDASVMQYRIIRHSSEERHLVSSGDVERNLDGAVVALFGTVQDITDLRQKERELQEKNSEMERFTYTVSHDLKSPLITLKTFLGYLQHDLANGDTGRIEKDIHFMLTAADRMDRMLEELLEVSRIGRIVNTPVVCTMRGVVASALDLVAGRTAEGRVDVLVEDADVVLFGDSLRLGEVWQNLVENACKFRGDQAQQRIEIGATGQGRDTVFFVRDNGIGIEPRHQEKIFGLFEKLDPESEGTGLGLALVKRIVELYGGKIWVESQGIGHGSCFCFTLPGAVRETGNG